MVRQFRCSLRCHDLELGREKITGGAAAATSNMKQIFWGLLFAAGFAFVGYLAVDGNIPPLHLLGMPAGPITCGVVGLVIGFYLGNR